MAPTMNARQWLASALICCIAVSASSTSACDPVPLGSLAAQGCGDCGPDLTCGGNVTSGTLEHLDYGRNENLCWLIPCSDTVYLNWRKLDTASGDTVQVHFAGGASSKFDGSITPTFQPPSGSGDILLHFESTRSEHRSGFVVDWSCGAGPSPLEWPFTPSVCGGYGQDVSTAEESGVITYPAGGSDYDSNLDLCWLIRCNSTVHVEFRYLKTASADDYVQFYERFTQSSRFSGETFPWYYQPNQDSRDVVVHFHSDSSGSGWGFELAWTCSTEPRQEDHFASVEAPSSCGDHGEELESTGGTGEFRYPPTGMSSRTYYTKCWLIRCDTKLRITGLGDHGYNYYADREVRTYGATQRITNIWIQEYWSGMWDEFESDNGPVVVHMRVGWGWEDHWFHFRWSCADTCNSSGCFYPDVVPTDQAYSMQDNVYGGVSPLRGEPMPWRHPIGAWTGISGVEVDYCKHECRALKGCAGFNYDSNSRSCYYFLPGGVAVYQSGWTAFALNPPPAMQQLQLEQWYERYVGQQCGADALPYYLHIGGDSRLSGSTFRQCAQWCDLSSSCRGFDYTSSPAVCNFYSAGVDPVGTSSADCYMKTVMTTTPHPTLPPNPFTVDPADAALCTTTTTTTSTATSQSAAATSTSSEGSVAGDESTSESEDDSSPVLIIVIVASVAILALIALAGACLWGRSKRTIGTGGAVKVDAKVPKAQEVGRSTHEDA